MANYKIKWYLYILLSILQTLSGNAMIYSIPYNINDTD